MNRGFVSLTSALLISFIMLAVAFSAELEGFLGRFNILDAESKERSAALAEACVEVAILNHLTGSAIAADFNCNVVQDIVFNQNIYLKTQAAVNKAHSNMFVVLDKDFVILEWKECDNFSSAETSC